MLIGIVIGVLIVSVCVLGFLYYKQRKKMNSTLGDNRFDISIGTAWIEEKKQDSFFVSIKNEKGMIYRFHVQNRVIDSYETPSGKKIQLIEEGE